jgi:HrpA-like RNA helicase
MRDPCRPGVCFRLFSRLQWQSLAECQLPEMLRSPLEPLCLSVKSVFGDRIVKDVLATALTPPDSAAVNRAMHLLRTRHLLDSEERLTSLGQHLTNIPLDPAMGALLGIVDRAPCTFVQVGPLWRPP